ncbi:MAG: ATP-binding protein [Candidatus Paceibacterota bacterium]
MKLNTKIVLTILQVSLIPWALGGFLAYLSSQEQINSQTYSNLDAIAAIQKNRLQDTLQNKLDILQLFTKSPWLTAYVRDYNAQPTLANKKRIQDLIEAPGRSLGIKKLFVMTLDGAVIASTDSALLGTDKENEDYFKRGVLANDESILEKDAAGIVSQYLVGPLISNGKTEGVMAVVTDANDIVDVAHDFTGLGKTGETLIVQKMSGNNALFLTSTRYDPSAALERVVTADKTNVPSVHAVAGEEAVFNNVVDYRGVKVFAATRYIPSVGWGIVVKIDKSEAFAPVVRLRELFFFIIAMVGVLMVFIGISMSRSITGPINKVTEFASKISQGATQQSIVVTSKDEVGILAATLNTMIERLQDAYATLEKKVLERTKALTEKTEEAKNSEKAALNIAADLKTEEEKLAEEKTRAESLANDLKKFKLALDDTSDQVIISDPEGMVVYANAAVERITGYRAEDALGKKAGALWKQPMPKEYYQNFWHTIKDLKTTFIGEIQNKRKNGEIYTAMINVSPVMDDAGNIIFFVGLERDITREKEIDTAKSEFISLASHQLRTPLTVVNWYAEMLLDDDAGKLNKKQKEYFDEIYQAGRQMNEIIKSFLHILRIESGTQTKNLVSTDLTLVAKSVLAELHLNAEKKDIRVIERYQKSIPAVTTDADLVRVITQNFVSNAIKYSSKGGQILVALETVDKGSVVAGKTAHADSLLVSVQDNGIGIPAADQDKIFTKFFRSENAKKLDPNGNGLGLYMSQIMVDIIGGSIWFISKEGKGTTFYVMLPMDGKRLV